MSFGNLIKVFRNFSRVTSKEVSVFRVRYNRHYAVAFQGLRHFCKALDNDLPHCNIGTIGHIDHGKTTLTASITKVLSEEGKARFVDYGQIDSAPEELARGITINACHIGYSTQKRRYAHTDCPGHKDFVKNMICGTSQMDGAILVVAATDGPMPQTREHLSLAQALGVNSMVVYINKADIVDDEMLELVDMEVRELLGEFGYDSENSPVICGSALCALQGKKEEIGKHSILKLIDACDSHVKLPERSIDGPFLLPIEKAFTVPGRGTVVIGTIERGEVKKGDKLQMLGFGKKIPTQVADVQRFKNSVDCGKTGENVGILVRGVKQELVQRGMSLCAENSLTQTDLFEAQIYVRSKHEGGRSKPIRSNYRQVLFMDLFNLHSLILLPEGQDMIMPGDTVGAKILLRKPMGIREGESFIIRENEMVTVSGKVTKLLPSGTIMIPLFNTGNPYAVKVEKKKKK